MKEVRTQFSDDRFYFLGLGSAVEKRFLNFEDIYSQKRVIGKNYHFGIKVSMSYKVQIQQRLVQDVFTMFGSVGGLYEFFCLPLGFIFGLLSSRLLDVS